MTSAKPSKSARKREQLARQELGEKLIALKEAELDSLSLDEDLRTAIRDAAGMKSHGALRRQKQLIGKLMRNVDTEPILAALHNLGARERHEKRLFAAAERWRDRLVRDGVAALDAFAAATGDYDDELRCLLAELDTTLDERTEKTLRRQVFRRIHAILVTTAR